MAHVGSGNERIVPQSWLSPSHAQLTRKSAGWRDHATVPAIRGNRRSGSNRKVLQDPRSYTGRIYWLSPISNRFSIL